MTTATRRRMWGIVAGATAIWAVALIWSWLEGRSAEALLALTAASALGIFALGSFLPLVERVYSVESQRIHPLSSWLLTAHTLIMGVAVLSLFRTFPGQAGPLLVGLVVAPLAVIAAAFFR